MKMLIVEDDDDIREILAKKMKAECFAVDTASDGAQGSYLARTNDYDIIILDNLMPQKTGMQVCEEIRNTGRSVPILMLSVIGEARQKVALINAGADDYVIKPFSFDELLARVRAVMRRPAQYFKDIITIDDLVIDLQQQRVKRLGKTIYLTRKEFMLLEYLVRNPGTVVSRGMIMEHVWDMSSDPFSNTIESHILSIRKKLCDGSRDRLIQTVPGRGYMIELT